MTKDCGQRDKWLGRDYSHANPRIQVGLVHSGLNVTTECFQTPRPEGLADRVQHIMAAMWDRTRPSRSTDLSEHSNYEGSDICQAS